MRGEGKETVCFAVLFTAGVASGMSAGIIPHPDGLVCTLLLCATAASALTGLSSVSPHSGYGSRCLIMFSFFLAGISTCTIQRITGYDLTARIAEWETAEKAAAGIRKLIGSLPFRHSGTAGLVTALLTGDRSGIPDDVTGYFRESGASHLLALSGMHLGIIYLIMTRILSLAGSSPAVRKARSVTAVTAAGFYTVLTGACASTVRAFLFILVNETAGMTGREKDRGAVFSTALVAQLTLSPESLASPGFQLSYLAMAGIYILYPVMESWYPDTQDRTRQKKRWHAPDPMRKIWKTASMSIACQIFTAPAAFIHFGTFPQYFLITNLIAIPITALAINLSVMALALHAAGLCPEFLTDWIDMAITLLCRSLETVSSLP